MRLDARVGDRVEIERAGDVIPKVRGVLNKDRPNRPPPFEFPAVCPECGSHAVREVDEKTGEMSVDVRCTGGLICPAQAVERLRHFVSRNAMDIEGFGEVYVDLFFKEGLVRTPADIFRLEKKRKAVQQAVTKLREAQAKAREEKKGKKAKKPVQEGERAFEGLEKLFAAIAVRRTVALQRLIFALGIPHVGEVGARILAEKYADMSSLIAAVEAAARQRPGKAYIELLAVRHVGEGRLKVLLERFSSSVTKPEGDNLEAQIAELGISRLPENARAALAEHYGTWTVFSRKMTKGVQDVPGPSYGTIADHPGIGVVMTESLIEFFGEKKNLRAVRDLLEYVKTMAEKIAANEGPLAGETIVFTGSLEAMSREEAGKKAMSLGAKVTDSVSKNTTLLVTGPGAGSKLKKAKKLGIRVIDEAAWLKLVE
jgi:DNA ligase (NAD+)